MLRLRRRYLRRLQLVFLLLLSLAAGTLVIQARDTFNGLLDRELASNAGTLGTSLGAVFERSLRYGLPLNRLVGVEDLLTERLRDTKVIAYVIITDRDGSVDYAAGREAAAMREPVHQAAAALDLGRIQESTTDLHLPSGKDTDIAYRLTAGSETVGLLHVGVPKYFFDAHLPALAPRLAAVLIALLVVAMVAVRRLVDDQIAAPIHLIDRVLERAKHRQFDLDCGPVNADFAPLASALDDRMRATNRCYQSTLQAIDEADAAHFDPAVLDEINQLRQQIVGRFADDQRRDAARREMPPFEASGVFFQMPYALMLWLPLALGDPSNDMVRAAWVAAALIAGLVGLVFGRSRTGSARGVLIRLGQTLLVVLPPVLALAGAQGGPIAIIGTFVAGGVWSARYRRGSDRFPWALIGAACGLALSSLLSMTLGELPVLVLAAFSHLAASGGHDRVEPAAAVKPIGSPMMRAIAGGILGAAGCLLIMAGHAGITGQGLHAAAPALLLATAALTASAAQRKKRRLRRTAAIAVVPLGLFALTILAGGEWLPLLGLIGFGAAAGLAVGRVSASDVMPLWGAAIGAVAMAIGLGAVGPTLASPAAVVALALAAMIYRNGNGLIGKTEIGVLASRK